MLNSCSFNGRQINFTCGIGGSNSGNKFTIVVGKNGTGKSRLLRAIVLAFIDVKKVDAKNKVFYEKRPAEINIDLHSNLAPQTVIGLSTSPFDRFPIYNNQDGDGEYRYLGLRGLGSVNLSLSYLSRTIGALISSVANDGQHAQTINEVLSLLGYQPFLETRLVSLMSTREASNIINSDNPLKAMHEWSARKPMPSGRLLNNNVEDFSVRDANQFVPALRTWLLRRSPTQLNIDITEYGVFDLSRNEPLSQDLLFLIQIGFFRLRDVALRRVGQDSLIRINDASSGEQCVLMSLLGIASYIKNDTLVCIDEPEICLHPEWQEEYIRLLMKTFSRFQGCHFVVATHSPQVVAQLENDNCFVVDLESGATARAVDFNHRSADFQLARVFRSPGFKNEYLARTVLNALQTISAGQSLSKKEDEEIQEIFLLKEKLEADDPVLRLMDILKESLTILKEA